MVVLHFPNILQYKEEEQQASMGISGRRSVVVVLATFLVAFMISVKAEESTVIPVKAEEIEDVDYIVPLDFSNFTEYVYKQDFIVVEFYAPWCGACKGFYPEYKKAASALVSHDPPTLRSSLQSYLAAEVIDLVDELFVKMFDKTHKNCQKELEAINRQYMFKPLEVRSQSYTC